MVAHLKENAAHRWILRHQAEDDPRWKQLIPYLLLRDPAGQVAACQRRGAEAEIPGCRARPSFPGIVNEERTPVDRVHWGLVFEAGVEERPAGGDETGELLWLSPRSLVVYELETWSRLALDLRFPLEPE